MDSQQHAPETGPLVGIVMGSDSDWPVMREAADALESFGVAVEVGVVSAHRMPEDMIAYGRDAAGRGLRVLVAGAGGAAHLPGMLAAVTPLPVIGVPVPLKHLDGMETARRIRERDGGVLIVFITNMAQYAIRGYAVGALDYVLKPVPYFAFSQQLQKALGQLEKRERHYLAVVVDGGMRRLDAAEIYYLESEGHKVHFYTEKEDFVVPGTLKNYEEKLVGRAFARCNSGYLVNLAQVSGVQQDMVQVGPYTLQISRPRRKAFMAGLADYIGGAG